MRVTAYFRSRLAASMAVERLGVLYEIAGPEPVIPLNGRSWVIEIDLPAVYVIGRAINPQVLARIVTVVNQYDGWIHSGDQS